MAQDTLRRTPRRLRSVTARAVAAFGVLVWCLGLMGLIDLSVPIYQPTGFYSSYLIEVGWGLLYTVLLGVPTAALVARPGAWPPSLQILVVAAALAVMGVVTPELGHVVPAALACGLVLAVRRLAGAPLRPPQGVLRRPAREDLVPVILVVLAAAPAVGYAIDMTRAAREGRAPVDITQGLDHWPAQGAFALALLGVAALAVVVRGHRVPAVSVAVAACWMGVASVRYPDHSASLGVVGGAAAVAWGVAFLVAVEVARRHGVDTRGGVAGSRRGG